MSRFLGRKSQSEPASGAATPKTADFEQPYDPTPNAEILFAGHLGHLTESQEEALKIFREKLGEAALYTPASEDGSTDASHSDVTLL